MSSASTNTQLRSILIVSPFNRYWNAYSMDLIPRLWQVSLPDPLGMNAIGNLRPSFLNIIPLTTS